MNLRPVTLADYDFLYRLLEHRRPEENISHRAMPDWAEHVDFNDSHPYKEDYIIERGGKPVGRVYLTHQRTIGIHTIDGSDAEVLELFKRPGLQAEVSPLNKKWIKILKRNGFKLKHFTYYVQG